MFRSVLLFSLLAGVVGCSAKQEKELPLKNEPVFQLASLNADVIHTIESWNNSALSSKPSFYLVNDPQFLFEQLSASWCGEETEQVLLENAFSSLCDNSSSYLDGQYCVNEALKAPIFAYDFKHNTKNAVCDDRVLFDVTVSVPFNANSQEWLDYVRSIGFLTKDQKRHKSIWAKGIEQKNIQRKREEDLNTLRAEQRAFYKNKIALEGKYNHVVCKLDLDSGFLMNRYVGRVLATFDNDLQVQLIDYIGRNPSSDFQKNKVIRESYSLWEKCDV
ncbi:hypothetical protein ACTFQF_00790 [Aliivibrio fischeri]|uniref:Lipoprotein, putative n=1 Tax=Aliivibrio fischeri (strain MJ11) TaxID=388396 RepID=B5EW88_ALIFM|nr:hypothetical protein [Aliivibrio fischeri]ACH64764.1 lipoprotein, putative [Aliivibrio fischeri MJ11]MUK37588.1 hypothetical protein [Aliivibrio fischeri]